MSDAAHRAKHFRARGTIREVDGDVFDGRYIYRRAARHRDGRPAGQAGEMPQHRLTDHTRGAYYDDLVTRGHVRAPLS